MKLKAIAAALGAFLGLVPALNAKPVYLYDMTNLYPGSRLDSDGDGIDNDTELKRDRYPQENGR